MAFSLAHLSDLHIGPLPPVSGRALMGKRLMGYLSWRTRRVREHRADVLDALRRHLRIRRPDHVVITGDLVNIALAAEFAQAARWLSTLGSPELLSVVPGNHDAYVAIDPRVAWAPLAPYMAGDDALGDALDIRFPYLRRRGPLALIGLSTAVPSGPGLATGRLGETQLASLDTLLAGLDPRRECRVILLHHPPLDGIISGRKRLVDADGLRGVLAARGAELVLHGHAHAPVSGEIPGPGTSIPVRGAASSSRWTGRPESGAQYQVHTIERTPGGWRIETESHVYRPQAGLTPIAEGHR